MNRKTILSIGMAICVVVVSACASAAPTEPASNTNSISTTAPTADNSLNTTVPTAPADESTAPGVPNTSGGSDTIDTSNLACGGGGTSASLTPALTEGPYYKDGSPEQADLYQPGMAGTKIVITGYVYDTNCQPVANAWLDFWQADANGNYDNSGYILRGHQFTDANGRYQLTTVVPGLYTGRTEHIHVKAQAPNGQAITSQLFFPDVAQNDSDRIFDQSLLLNIQESSDGLQGQFNFVVPAG